MNKKICAAFLALWGILSLSACAATKAPAENAAVPAETAAPTEATKYTNAEGMQIKVTAGDVEVTVTLNGSKAAADLVNMLPLELTLIERNRFAKGMTLPAPLSAEEKTTRQYEIGDFGYWDAGPDLAIFYDDIYEQTVVPVIPLGKAESGAEKLANTSGTVTLELVEDGTA